VGPDIGNLMAVYNLWTGLVDRRFLFLVLKITFMLSKQATLAGIVAWRVSLQAVLPD